MYPSVSISKDMRGRLTPDDLHKAKINFINCDEDDEMDPNLSALGRAYYRFKQAEREEKIRMALNELEEIKAGKIQGLSIEEAFAEL
jgi:hypothetical protein